MQALCHSLPMGANAEQTIVRAACPHDCPDTCAHARHRRGPAGRWRCMATPSTRRPTARCAPRCRAMPERTYHAERVLQPLRRIGPKGSGRFECVTWDDALADIAGRLPAHRRARRPQRRSHRAVQLCRHDGPVAGREHRRALLPSPGRVAARTAPSARRLAARPWRRTYGAKGRHARGALRREAGSSSSGAATRSPRTCISGPMRCRPSAPGRGWSASTRAAPTRRRSATSTIALLPGTDGAFALGLMHELIRQPDALDPRLHSPRHTRRLARTARAGVLQWPPERAPRSVCGIGAEQVRALARDYGPHQAGGDPRQLRHAARARGGGATRPGSSPSCRASSEPGGTVPAACCCRARAGSAMHATTPGCSGPTCSRHRACPGQRTLNMSTIGDDLLRKHRRAARRRHALRGRRSRRSSSTTATRWRWRPARRRWCVASPATTSSPSCSSTS